MTCLSEDLCAAHEAALVSQALGTSVSADLAAHLAACPSCRRKLAVCRQMRSGLLCGPFVAPRASVVARLTGRAPAGLRAPAATRAPRIALVWCLVALLALALAGTASAHSNLVSSDPKDGATLAAAPPKITLVFSEELQPDSNLISVTDAGGAQVDNGDTRLDLNDPKRVTLTVTLKAGLGAGTYTISWKNMSADGHSEEGSLSFKVAAATAAPTPTSVPATGAGDAAPLGAILAGALLLAGAGLGLRRWVR